MLTLNMIVTHTQQTIKRIKKVNEMLMQSFISNGLCKTRNVSGKTKTILELAVAIKKHNVSYYGQACCVNCNIPSQPNNGYMRLMNHTM